MDTWKLRDGTTVKVGGDVEGDSIVAGLLAAEMQDAKAGRICSGYGMSPHFEPLDVNVPYLLDFYLRDRFDVIDGPIVNYPNPTVRPDLSGAAVY